MTLHQKGDAAQAEKLYREVLAAQPDEPNAWHLLGVLASKRGDLDTAEQHIRKAIGISNRVFAYHNNLGGILREKGDMAGAVIAYEAAFALAPKDEDVQKNLTQVLHTRARELTHELRGDEAQAAYRRVLEFAPDDVPTLNNLASLVQHMNDRPGARVFYDRALEIKPGYLPVLYNRAICYLTEQKLAEGWADFTASQTHWYDKQDARQDLAWMKLPLWDGQDLRGKKILVWGDQGIGDEVVYASMIPELMARGAIITIECTRRLVLPFARSFVGVTAVERGSPPVPSANFDYHAPWIWLARCLRPNKKAFPGQRSFLKADMAKVGALRERYRAFGKKKVVGLSWYTSSQPWGFYRSVQLPDMLKDLPLKDLLIIDMQYGDTADAWQQAKQHFPDLTIFHDPEVAQLQDMDIFAAQIMACDHIYTISNTTSHLAGALGVPATILMSDAGLTWYWFEKGETCPWYPSLKLIRPDVPDRLKVAAKLVSAP